MITEVCPSAKEFENRVVELVLRVWATKQPLRAFPLPYQSRRHDGWDLVHGEGKKAWSGGEMLLVLHETEGIKGAVETIRQK